MSDEIAEPTGIPRSKPSEDRKRERPWPKGNGFNQFGYPVSTARQVAALDCAVEVMGVCDLEADPVIREAALRIKRDDIEGAMRVMRNIVDETGVYRLLAVMCCD